MKGIKTHPYDVSPPAGDHRHILALLLLDRLAHSAGNLLADRIGHLYTMFNMCEYSRQTRFLTTEQTWLERVEHLVSGSCLKEQVLRSQGFNGWSSIDDMYYLRV